MTDGLSLHDTRDHSFADAAMATLLAENKRLQRWKTDAIAVLNRWDDAYERSHIDGTLGDHKPDLMADEIVRLRAENEQFRSHFREVDEIVAEWEDHTPDNPPPGWTEDPRA